MRADSQRNECMKSQDAAKEILAAMRDVIEQPPASWKPVEVHDNLIRVIPV